MIIAWTGHRPGVFADARAARDAGERVASAVLGRAWPAEFISGGQRGVDQWAASTALARGVPYHLVLPMPNARFCAGWTAADRATLEALLARAASVAIVDSSGALGALAYDLRNEAVVRRADLLVAVWTGMRRGGTFHTICTAWALGVPVEETLLEGSGGGSQGTGGRGL